MIRVALRGLAGRKLRAVLTAFAIVLGVAMTSGTLVLTDAIDSAFKNIFTEQYAGTDAVISGKQAVSFEGEGSEKPSIPASLLPEVRQQPSVAAATGLVVDATAAKILDKEDKVVDTGGAPAFGFGVDFSQTRFNPLKLKSGRWPSSENEVAIDAGTADEVGYKAGDMVKVASLGPVESFRLTGIASYGDQESLGAATFAVFTLPTAQRLFDREDQFDAIWIAATPGVAPEQLVADLEPLLPANAEALTSTEQTREDLKTVEFTKYIRYFLLSFAGIALFVGAFVIFNTLSITVAQRIREFATLRTIGASRRQVLTTVTLEALIIGFLASVVGLIGGLFLARGVNALFKAVNADLPATALNLTTSIVIYSLLLGTLVTLVAGIFPAVRATRVPPIAAVREGATLPASRISKYTPYIALVVVAIAVALLAYGMFGSGMTVVVRLGSLAIGCLLLFVGVALISPRLVPWISAGVRPIAKWLMLGIGYLIYPTRLGAWLVRTGAVPAGALVPVAARALRRRCPPSARDRPRTALALRVRAPVAQPGADVPRHRRRDRDGDPPRRLARHAARAARSEARPSERQAGSLVRPGNGQARGRELPSSSGSDRRDGCRADDRPGARHVHLGPRERHEGVEPRRDRETGQGAVPRDVDGRLHPVSDGHRTMPLRRRPK